jgi:ribosomal protein S18 acetylase RimI-like enzyme
MTITTTNTLSAKQAQAVTSLYTACASAANYPISLFMENEFNIEATLPCFYLAMDGGKCIGFLSVFMPNPQEWEVTALVHPDYRRQGIFSDLFDCAMDCLEDTLPEQLFFTIDPANEVARQLLLDMGFAFSYSEYTMIYDSSPIDTPTMPEGICVKKNDSGYALLQANTTIGTCPVDASAGAYTIYAFEILPQFRGKGYGSLLLDFVIHQLQHENNQLPILLEVNGENTVAYNMYLRHHFRIHQQLDYYTYILV